MRDRCVVDKCVRKVSGAKSLASFMIERTCHYAKAKECLPRKRKEPRFRNRVIQVLVRKDGKA